MRSGDNENAKTYFNRVAELFPGTENEATAKSNLNSMGDTTADDTKTADTKEKDMQKSISFLGALLRACSNGRKGI